ncbi:hypothetical protein A5717_25915 [Mycolicibacterium porcinum]|uniref:hypothetical protein n=1 Tax=Mycolicibacterium porcinum TaxID=39693 RepID=UPI00080BC6DB|nr:hypothetical protein [Mycolicibacterium porcinum]OCB09215.1 hypothetical protein A5717_25915 [Mycolicibacterium porcinum]
MAWSPADEIGERDPLLPKAKAFLEPRFSYAKILAGDRSDVITAEYLEAQQIYKANKHNDFLRGRAPVGMPDVDPNSPKFDWAVKKNMGLLETTTPSPTVKPYYCLGWPGTWGAWNNGFGWDAMQLLDKNRFDLQGLGYNTNAFMIGNDPTHSYLDMLADGVAEGRRWALPDRRKKILFGYSGGAGCVVEFLRQWPADRRDEIVMVHQFGDPNRPPGRTLLGNDPGGHGISEDFPPDWVLDRYYSFTLPGDMYPNAAGLLPLFYDILTRMEATPEFAMYLFNLFVSQLGGLTQVGGAMLGLSGNPLLAGFGQLAQLLPLLTAGQGQTPNLLAMIFNIGNIVISLKKLLDFLISQDHNMYGDPGHAAFDGMTAVQKSAQIVNALP